jgi:outer membrane lipoprotein carrier protein
MRWKYAALAVAITALAAAPILAWPQGRNPDEGPPANPNTANPLSLDEVIAKLQANYSRINTYQADFDQELYSMSQDRVISRGSGAVMYKKPGKMVWHYGAPEEHYYYADGNTVYDYAPADKEAYVVPMKDAVIKSFLLGLGDVRQEFEVSFRGGVPMTPSGLYQVELVPKNEDDKAAYGAITLYLNPDMDYMVQFTEMIDALGNHNRLRFKNMRFNLSLDDSLFKFVPPPDVKVTTAGPEGGGQ